MTCAAGRRPTADVTRMGSLRDRLSPDPPDVEWVAAQQLAKIGDLISEGQAVGRSARQTLDLIRELLDPS
jgi:hypothetical protein